MHNCNLIKEVFMRLAYATRSDLVFWRFGLDREMIGNVIDKILLILNVLIIGSFFFAFGMLAKTQWANILGPTSVVLAINWMRGRLHRFLIINPHFERTPSFREVCKKTIFSYFIFFCTFTLTGFFFGHHALRFITSYMM